MNKVDHTSLSVSATCSSVINLIGALYNLRLKNKKKKIISFGYVFYYVGRPVMKNKNKLTDEERELVTTFIKMKYPTIYKTDKTDRILFVELVEFDVCPYLLGQRQIDSEQYSYILNECERYLSQTDISIFDEYAKDHFKIMVKLIDLFKKHYKM